MSEDIYVYDGQELFDYDCDVCPICGGKIKHPYIGQLTDEQLEEDSDCCLWMEVIDESNTTLGYTPICKTRT